MSVNALDDDDYMMRKMQGFRLQIIEGVMHAPADKPDERIIDKDPKMLRVALSAMDGVDNSIQKQRRLELDQQSQASDKDFQNTVVGLLNTVMESGGMALNKDPNAVADATAPAPQLGLLPEQTIGEQEAHIGVETIDYDDIMTKRK